MAKLALAVSTPVAPLINGVTADNPKYLLIK